MDFEFEPEEKKTPSGRGGPRHPHKIRLSDDIPDNEPVPVDSADFFRQSLVSSQIAARRSEVSTISSSLTRLLMPCVRGP